MTDQHQYHHYWKTNQRDENRCTNKTGHILGLKTGILHCKCLPDSHAHQRCQQIKCIGEYRNLAIIRLGQIMREKREQEKRNSLGCKTSNRVNTKCLKKIQSGVSLINYLLTKLSLKSSKAIFSPLLKPMMGPYPKSFFALLISARLFIISPARGSLYSGVMSFPEI